MRSLQREALLVAVDHRRAFLKTRAGASAAEGKAEADSRAAEGELAEAWRLEAEAGDEEAGAVVADALAME